MPPNSISTHISAAIGIIVAAIAALHPGFHLGAALTQDIVVVGTVGAILLEGQHGWLKAKALQFEHELEMIGKHLGVTATEVKSAAVVVEAKLKPADAQAVSDVMGGAEEVAASLATPEVPAPPA